MVLCSDHRSLIFDAKMLVMTFRRTSSREIGLILSNFVDPGDFGTRTTVILLSCVGIHPLWMQRLVSCMIVVRKLSSSFFKRAAERSDAPGVLLPIRLMVRLNSSRSSWLGMSLFAGICWLCRISRIHGAQLIMRWKSFRWSSSRVGISSPGAFSVKMSLKKLSTSVSMWALRVERECLPERLLIHVLHILTPDRNFLVALFAIKRDMCVATPHRCMASRWRTDSICVRFLLLAFMVWRINPLCSPSKYISSSISSELIGLRRWGCSRRMSFLVSWGRRWRWGLSVPFSARVSIAILRFFARVAWALKVFCHHG